MLAIDLAIAAVSLPLALFLRLGSDLDVYGNYVDVLVSGVPIFVGIAAAVFVALGLYKALWRYVSLQDLVRATYAATIAIAVFMGALFLVNRLDPIPRSLPLIQWCVLVLLLASSRVVYRRIVWEIGAGSAQGQRAWRVPILLVGINTGTETFLRATTVDPEAPFAAVGLVDIDAKSKGRTVHSVRVLGQVSELRTIVERLRQRGIRPQRILLSEPLGEFDLPELLRTADQLGMVVARLPALTDFKEALGQGRMRFEAKPVALEDLLRRPRTVLDRGPVDRLVKGRRVLVTGAGGSIGAELCRHIAEQEPAELTLLDISEFNLYSIDLDLREKHQGLLLNVILADIRDREVILRLFTDYQPELVFHAAALKHVPLVEVNASEGVLTNAIGTRNVADAAATCRASAMVQISTDKAVNPVSVMGASKRLAEYYCQALDLVAGTDDGPAFRPPTRFMTVRFGNVLGSSGSVIPLFQRQLAQGGPLTVTHPEMRRYFMTVREAVELVLQASAYGIERSTDRGRIFVLEMGQPVRISDIARQVIRLAGYRPEQDVRIEYVGLRPGEKLEEELFDESENLVRTGVDGVLVAAPMPIPLAELRPAFDEISRLARSRDHGRLFRLLANLVPGCRLKDVTPGRSGNVAASGHIP